MDSRTVRQVVIENYKSIRNVDLKLGRINVFIGANGAGKSNILEAIAYGSAASRQRLENEYLSPRGVRFVAPEFMRSAFPETAARVEPSISFQWGGDNELIQFSGGSSAPRHVFEHDAFVQVNAALEAHPEMEALLREAYKNLVGSDEYLAGMSDSDLRREVIIPHLVEQARPPEFMIFAPENSALRIFQSEQQVLPLGARGEGLFAHLKALTGQDGGRAVEEISKHLSALDWFDAFEIPKDLAPGERSLLIRDRYLREGALFDQRSTNEGFLYLLFYLTLFVSPETPKFFAIDNVDAALNPKLATRLMRSLVELATAHEKQVLFTTHSPAVLDGLDLTDDEQRLFTVVRGDDGGTRVRRIPPPRVAPGDAPVPLSVAFVRGYLGALPDNF